jgi:hypothetical protein
MAVPYKITTGNSLIDTPGFWLLDGEEKTMKGKLIILAILVIALVAWLPQRRFKRNS